MPGTLYIAATPIGNLADASPRLAEVLAKVAVIACEDTRQTRKLLDHLGISTPLVSYHEHNEKERAGELTARLVAGESLALVSDAGTPLISDPGYRLVEAALAAGIPVVPIPGPAALLTALPASGLPSNAFYFGGFLAHKPLQRRKQLEKALALDCTAIFYEAPHRILDTLADLEALAARRRIVLGRELTKLHEEFLRGRAAELRAQLAARASIKGEFTVLIGPPEEGEDRATAEQPIEEALAALLAGGMGRMDALKLLARQRGLSKREVYRMVQSS